MCIAFLPLLFAMLQRGILGAGSATGRAVSTRTCQPFESPEEALNAVRKQLGSSLGAKREEHSRTGSQISFSCPKHPPRKQAPKSRAAMQFGTSRTPLRTLFSTAVEAQAPTFVRSPKSRPAMRIQRSEYIFPRQKPSPKDQENTHFSGALKYRRVMLFHSRKMAVSQTGQQIRNTQK